MTQALADAMKLLDLERIEVNIFRGSQPADGGDHVFGGQVAGQALVAATRTVDKGTVHSLHSYFLRSGDPSIPILYEVDRIRDGRSFTTRRVVAIQHGRAIFNMAASFHIDEPGFDHQSEMPEVPAPETLPDRVALKAELGDNLPPIWRDRSWPVDMRYVTPHPYTHIPNRKPEQMVWLRADGRLPDDQLTHRCFLTYLSDIALFDSALIPHASPYREDIMGASLDHMVWFHRPFRADEWLLYVTDSPSAQGSRGLNRGQFFTADGVLIASVAQEGLMRQIDV